MILGDFNDQCNDFECDRYSSELKNRLLNLARLNDLHQLIKEPTRVTHSSESLLDLIFIDCPRYVTDSGVNLPIANVDHHGVFCCLRANVNDNFKYSRKIFDYSAADYINLCLALYHDRGLLFLSPLKTAMSASTTTALFSLQELTSLYQTGS